MSERKTLWTCAELLDHTFPPIPWVIPELLTSGLTVLAGAPKLGKSWLALAVCFAVSVGGRVLGHVEVPQYMTLYLALEDTARRLQSRLQQIGATHSRELVVATEWSRGRDGIRQLREFLDSYRGTKLVVIDTWARFWRVADGNDYQEVTYAAAELKAVADEYDVAIVLVHHARKAEVADFVDAILGSVGLGAAADTTWVLNRGRGKRDAVLSVTGRDIEENEFALRFDAECATWVIEGTTAAVQESTSRQDIYDLLAESEGGMRPKQVADQLKKNYHTTKNLIRRMADEGVLTSLSGVYTVADTPHSPVVSVVHSPSGAEESIKRDYTTTETTDLEHAGNGRREKEELLFDESQGGFPLV